MKEQKIEEMEAKKECEKYSYCHVLFKANDASMKPKTRKICFLALNEECTIESAVELFERRWGAERATLYSPVTTSIVIHGCRMD